MLRVLYACFVLDCLRVPRPLHLLSVRRACSHSVIVRPPAVSPVYGVIKGPTPHVAT
jgi:hypothetical protein